MIPASVFHILSQILGDSLKCKLHLNQLVFVISAAPQHVMIIPLLR